MQANRRVRQHSSYRCSPLLSKPRSQSGLDRLLPEAPGREVARRPRPWPAPLDQRPRALGLGLEPADRLLGQALGPQPVADRLVAVTSGRERRRPHARDPPVVDDPRTLEHREPLSGRRPPPRAPPPSPRPPPGGRSAAAAAPPSRARLRPAA